MFITNKASNLNALYFGLKSIFMYIQVQLNVMKMNIRIYDYVQR